jgi:hypothetical protein
MTAQRQISCARETLHKVWYILWVTRPGDAAGVAKGSRFVVPLDEQSRRLARTLRAFQERAQEAGPAASASYSLIGSIVLFGGIGYGLDRWLGTQPACTLGGLLLGMAAGFYFLVKIGTRR